MEKNFVRIHYFQYEMILFREDDAYDLPFPPTQLHTLNQRDHIFHLFSNGLSYAKFT